VASRPARAVRAVRAGEDAAAFLSIFLLALLLLVEVAARKIFNTGVPDSGVYVEHLVLAATFIAGAVTSREKKHLALATGVFLPESLKAFAAALTAVLASGLTLAFGLSAASFAWNAFTAADMAGIFPKRLVVLIMAVCFLAMSLRFVTGLERKRARLAAGIAGAALGLFLGFEPLVQLVTRGGTVAMPALAAVHDALKPLLVAAAGPMIFILVGAALLGLPIFTVLGGIGYLLFA
jgi:TRAP-type C4-dicarboxylate transport system permease small subunit